MRRYGGKYSRIAAIECKKLPDTDHFSMSGSIFFHLYVHSPSVSATRTL